MTGSRLGRQPGRDANRPGAWNARPRDIQGAPLPSVPEPVQRRFRCRSGLGPPHHRPRTAGRRHSLYHRTDFSRWPLETQWHSLRRPDGLRRI